MLEEEKQTHFSKNTFSKTSPSNTSNRMISSARLKRSREIFFSSQVNLTGKSTALTVSNFNITPAATDKLADFTLNQKHNFQLTCETNMKVEHEQLLHYISLSQARMTKALSSNVNSYSTQDSKCGLLQFLGNGTNTLWELCGFVQITHLHCK